MPYIERITRAGKTIEVARYFTSRYKKQGIKRGDKVKPTTEQQRENTEKAAARLRQLLNENYDGNNLKVDITYEKTGHSLLIEKK